MSLREYKAKRNFARTKEPAGKLRKVPAEREHRFIIQKHAARRLHYDFRLEMQGVLKSWAVPKGFPFQKGDRRLAVEVEDHPLDYADFEGVIPEGNYGAGTVMVWDTGTYSVSGDDPPGALKAGKLHMWLKGRKLKGEWTLVRMRGLKEEEKPQWLLLKTGEDVTPISKTAEDRSVLTRRTLQAITKAADREWHSDRPASETAARSKRLRSSERSRTAGKSARKPGVKSLLTTTETGQLPKNQPRFLAPMKALTKETLPQGPDWTYELKFDGVRAIAIKQGDQINLISRAGNEMRSRYSPVVNALKDLPSESVVLDGEIVAVDENGRPDFQLLQCYQIPGARKPPLLYYVFDVLHLEGRDLTGLQLERRKAIAESVVGNSGDVVRFSGALPGTPVVLVRALKARGLEGIIAKKKDSIYESGRRSGAWVKYKWGNEQEFVIGGYTEPKGARSYFGSVLVGYYEDKKLLYAGRVGTGFDEKLLRMLYEKFQSLKVTLCPFTNLPEQRPGQFGSGLTASQMRLCTWLKPELVCQVRFTEWTRDNQLRQPVFLGLREDKLPKEVTRGA